MNRAFRVEFTRPKNKPWALVSLAIRRVQRTPYSHVRFAWERITSKGDLQTMVYEASGDHVRFVGPKAVNPVEIVAVFEIDMSKEEQKKLVDFAIDMAHVSYGKWQLIGIGVAKLLRLKKNPFAKGPYSQVCSELIQRGLLHVKGWRLDLNPDLAGPKEIEESLNKLIKDKVPGIQRIS